MTSSCNHRQSQRRARPLLGTLIEIQVSGSVELLSVAFDAAFAAIEHVQRLMSFYDERSDVARINAAATAEVCQIHPQTYQVLQFAQALSVISDGVFDITIAPVLVHAGFLPNNLLALQTAVEAASNYRDLVLMGDNRVCWRRKGWIDLGGIAKGYAVDCAIVALQSSGIDSAIVNAGGDLRCFGEPQPIHVRQPDIPVTLLALGWLRDAAIATSSGYFSGITINGQPCDPLVDTRSRNCTTWDNSEMQSVSVVATTCMVADALTKVVRLVPDFGAHILMCFHAQAILIHQSTIHTCGVMRLIPDANSV